MPVLSENMEIVGFPRTANKGQHGDDELDQRRRQLLKAFSNKMKLLLTESDQDYLLAALKEYQMYNQIDKLIHCLRAVLDTPAKLDLLRDIRHFISPAHLVRYDTSVPYHNMAHPWMLSGVATMPRPRRQRVHVLTTPQQTPKLKARIINGSTEALATEPAPIKVILLVKDETELLGFSIRGGSEHGLGIFVSEVEPGTPAEQAGLVAGDNIIEVNNISFDNIASSSAVKVLTGSQRLRMIVRRINKIPDFRSAKERVSWYSVHDNCILEGSFGEHGIFHLPPGTSYTDLPERCVNLVSHRGGHQYLGFNIRGGSEYGLGVYVSKVDPGGLAEECGLRVGDLIVEVNGHSFLRVTHTRAVDAVRSQKQLVLMVKDVGMYPSFKEIFAEYQWLDTLTGTISKTRTYQRQTFGSTGHINSIPVRISSPSQATHQLTEYPRESHVQSYAQTDNESDEELDVPVFCPMDVGVQTDLEKTKSASLLPHNNDIELRKKPLGDAHRSQRKSSPGRYKEKSPPRPTLAVRAMELETRAKYPELAEQLDSMSPEQREVLYNRAYLDVEENESKSRSFKDIMFGSKFEAGCIKCSSQGANPSKNRSRKPLTSLNFIKKTVGSCEDVSCLEPGTNNPLVSCRQKSQCSMVEECARRVLTNKDEINAIVRHVRTYEKEKNLNQLLNPLLAILDTHEKLQLLREIRSVILPAHLPEYDHVVINQEQLCLRRQAQKQSPRKQYAYSKPYRHTDNNANITSPGHKSIYKSTRHEDYKKDIEAQQRHLKEEEKKKYARIKPGLSISLSGLDQESTYCNDPDSLDTRSSHDVRYSCSTSDLDKTGLALHNLNKADDISRSSAEIPGAGVPFSGPFLEDLDTHHQYYSIGDVNRARSLHEAIPGTQSHAGGPITGSRTKSKTSTVKQEPEPSPVYATVKKTDKKSADPLPDLTYIESNDLYAGVQNVDLPEADAQLLNQSTEPMAADHSPSKSDEFWDSQSETYQEAKKALNFLDGLDTEGDYDDDEGGREAASRKPSASQWSSTPDTPRSDVSSLAESRFGSYDVNPSQSGSPRAQTKSSCDRSPPRFVPPPPPDSPPPDSPPPEMENDAVLDQQSSVSGVRYTKRQHSYDKETVIRNVLNEASPSRQQDPDEYLPPVPRKSTLSVFRIHSDLTNDQASSRSVGDLTTILDGDGDTLEIVLRKAHASLGFSISGGVDSKTQPDIKVDQVFPGGAAAAEGTLQAGMVILSVDGHSLRGVKHRQAVDIIRKTFSNKYSATMCLKVKRPLQV